MSSFKPPVRKCEAPPTGSDSQVTRRARGLAAAVEHHTVADETGFDGDRDARSPQLNKAQSVARQDESAKARQRSKHQVETRC